MAEPATGFQPGPITEAAAPTPLSTGVYTAPPFDATEPLPPCGADKMRMLRQHRNDRHRLVPEFESVRSASLARIEAENALKRLTDHPQNFGRGLPETDPLVAAAKKHLDKMTDEFKRLTELQEIRSAAFQTAGAALANVEAWLREGRPHGTVLEDYDGPEPKLDKGETVLDGIERLRRRGRELKADLHRIASAPYPSKYAKALLREAIETQAQRGTPDVSTLIEHGDRGSIIWPTLRVQAEVHGAERSLAFHEVVDVAGLFAFFLKPTVISFLDGLVDAEKDDPASLSHADREVRTAEAMADLLSVERDESWFVWEAQAQNLPVEHRADISPLAILQVRLVTTPRADAAETSPGHSWPMRR
jgi:hypothetical protein